MRGHRWSKTGLTLTETLVAAFLSVLLIGLLARILWPVLGASARGSARIELQQSAHRALNSIARSLSATERGSVSLLSGAPSGLAIPKISGVTSGGFQSWSDTLTLYFWDPANPGPGRGPSGVPNPTGESPRSQTSPL